MEERKSRYELFLEEEARKAQPTKRCSKCKEVKVLSEYHKNKAAPIGVVSRCKECSQRKKYKNRVDMFWKRYWRLVKRVGDCSEWQGSCDGGVLPVCRWEYKKIGVRRVVYNLTLGIEVPTGMSVMTTCKNRRCVRQSHLTLEELDIVRFNNVVGTAPDGDQHWTRMYPEKAHVMLGRQGEQHSRVVLDETLVRHIRQLRSQGLTGKVIAEMVDVSQTAVWSALYNWKHVQ